MGADYRKRKREEKLAEAFLTALARALANGEVSGARLAEELRIRGVELPPDSELDALDDTLSHRRALAQAVVAVIRYGVSDNEIIETLREALQLYGLGDIGDRGTLYQRYALPGGFPLSGGTWRANEGPGEQWESDVKHAFGKAVRALREEVELGIPELGQKAGLHVGTLRSLEQAESEPMLATIFSVAFALRITPSRLVTEFETLLIGRHNPYAADAVEKFGSSRAPAPSELERAIGMASLAVRRWTDLSQEHFARKVGIDRTYLSRIERGKHDCGLFAILRIAGAGGITGTRFVQTVEAVLRSRLRKSSAEEFLFSSSHLQATRTLPSHAVDADPG
jgi:transcriptional regulator with XRE-family HTH domain